MRPLQWSKNVLVVVAPAAAGVLGHTGDLVRLAIAFAVFCAAASAVYLVNDVVDAGADRQHPEKCRRPVASGALSRPLALGSAAILATVALSSAWALGGWALVGIVATYLGVSAAYSVYLKHQPVIELVAVASGFVLRAIAGGAATHVPLSSWFLVVTSFGALFVVTGKRSGEYLRLGGERARHRQVLAQYTQSFLRSTLILTASVTVAAYCLWAFGQGGLLTRAGHHLVWIQLTVVPMTIGLLHVLRLIDAGQGEAPEALVRHDRLLQGLGIAWCALMAIGLYG